MPSRAELSFVGAAALAACSSAPPATSRVPPTYADARPIAAAPMAAVAAQPPVPRPGSAQIDAPGAPPQIGNPPGPIGTAGNGAPVGYDRVGYASWYGEEAAGQPTASGAPFQPDAATAAHRTLPLGSYAEVTALDTGRTILVLVNDRGPSRADREIDLSRGAAQALGISDHPAAAVRVRAVTPLPADMTALRAGQLASPRLDTPDVVLRALRRQLPPSASSAIAARVTAAPTRAPAKVTAPRSGASDAAPGAPARPTPGPTPKRAKPVAPTAASGASPRSAPSAAASGYLVQVAAFSSEERARNLARVLRGTVAGGNGVWRVRLGPFRDRAAAQAARDAAARRGYGDAAILTAS